MHLLTRGHFSKTNISPRGQLGGGARARAQWAAAPPPSGAAHGSQFTHTLLITISYSRNVLQSLFNPFWRIHGNQFRPCLGKTWKSECTWTCILPAGTERFQLLPGFDSQQQAAVKRKWCLFCFFSEHEQISILQSIQLNPIKTRIFDRIRN